MLLYVLIGVFIAISLCFGILAWAAYHQEKQEPEPGSLKPAGVRPVHPH